MKTATTKNTLLRWYFDERGDHADFEVSNREGMRLRQEQECLIALAKIGELAGPVAHEINNFINAMLLQLSVIESRLPTETRGELAAIREQAVNVTSVLKQLRECRKRQQREPRPVDLHRTIWQAIASLNREADERGGSPRLFPSESKRTALAANSESGGIPVLLRLARGLPQVDDKGMNLRILAAFLLNHAIAVSGPDGLISIRTVVNEQQVLFGVEDTGPNLETDLLPRLFETSAVTRPGANGLELAACKGLVANLGGRIQAENLRGRGVAVCVQLPLAQPAC